MACLTNEEIQNIIGGISCNNFDPLVDLVEEINERACAGCLGIVPAGTSTTDFLTVALAPEGGLAFDPVNPDCDEIWVKEEDTENRYVSLDDGLTWCQVCNGFCFAPEIIPDGTAIEDILDEGWGDGSAGSGLLAIPDSTNCSVLVALVGCDICFAVNDSVDCDLGDGTAGTGTDWKCLSGIGSSLFEHSVTFASVPTGTTTPTTSFTHTLRSNPSGFVSNPVLNASDDEFTIRSGTYQYEVEGYIRYSEISSTLVGGTLNIDLYNITDSSIITLSNRTFTAYPVSTGESVPSPFSYSLQFAISSTKRLRIRGDFTVGGDGLVNTVGTVVGTFRLTRIG